MTLSYLIHSSEDTDKLHRIVCEALGINDAEIMKESLEGHYGNDIGFAKAHLTGKRAKEVVQRISLELSEKSRKELLAQLDISMDEHDALYLRLDRQSMGSGLSLSDQEPIRVKIKFKFRIDDHDLMRSAFIEEMKL